MISSHSHLTSGAARMNYAAQDLRRLVTSMQDFSRSSDELTNKAQQALSLPPEQRIQVLRELLGEFARELNPIADHHNETVPRFFSHVGTALLEIRSDLRSAKPSPTQVTDLKTAIKGLRETLRDARTNIEFFRGMLHNVPDIGVEQALSVRDRVGKALQNAVTVYEKVENDINDLISEIESLSKPNGASPGA